MLTQSDMQDDGGVGILHDTLSLRDLCPLVTAPMPRRWQQQGQREHGWLLSSSCCSSSEMAQSYWPTTHWPELLPEFLRHVCAQKEKKVGAGKCSIIYHNWHMVRPELNSVSWISKASFCCNIWPPNVQAVYFLKKKIPYGIVCGWWHLKEADRKVTVMNILDLENLDHNIAPQPRKVLKNI